MNLRQTLCFALLCMPFTLFLHSCPSEEGSVSSQAQKNELTNVGVLHNEELNRVFGILARANNVSRSSGVALTKEEAMNIAKESAIETVSNMDLPENLKDTALHVIDQTFRDPGFYTDSLCLRSLTAGQEKYVSILDELMVDNDTLLVSLQERIENIRTLAKSDLNEDEFIAVSTGCDIASKTLEYWHDNENSWIEISGSNDPSQQDNGNAQKKKDFNWKSLGRADMAGAVGGASGYIVRTLILGGPLGWKAVIAYAAGSAAAVSVANAVYQIWPE